LIERKWRRDEFDTFITTLHRPQVDSLEPNILIFFGICSDPSGISETWVSGASGLWATRGRGKYGGICTAVEREI
jgi:hypothetical protein